MGAQNPLCVRQGGLQAREDLEPRDRPQRASRRRDRHIEMSGKFWLPAHI
jgi:hypothetical protein